MGKNVYTSKFKVQVVLELLSEQKQINELAAEHNLNPNLIRTWRKEFLDNSARIFEQSKNEKELARKQKELDTEREELLKKIGQLMVERDWLKKKSVEIFGSDYEKKFNKKTF